MRFLTSVKNALRGLFLMLSRERNFQIQIWISVVVIAMGFFVHLTTPHWLIIVLCIGAVLGMESINSAIENLCDLVHPDNSPRVRDIKDISAGAVTIVAIAAMVIGILIFLPYVQAFI